MEKVFPAIRRVHVRTINHALGLIAAEGTIDLVLLDYWLPHVYCPRDVNELYRQWPRMPVVVVSAFRRPDDGFRRSVLYACKSLSSESLRRAVHAALEGGVLHCNAPAPDNSDSEEIVRLKRRLCTLTDQQFRVLGMLCRGLLNKQIAHALSIEETTVKAHNRDIFRKLQVVSRVEAALLVAELNLGSVLRMVDMSKEFAR
ncbi:MAG: DNA-binding response regulator [Hyphomicrobium sp.]